MDLMLTENRPETCAALGLECNACVRKGAGSVARICVGLESAGIQQLFLQLYPSIGCRAMAPTFELAYHESSMATPMCVGAVAAA